MMPLAKHLLFGRGYGHQTAQERHGQLGAMLPSVGSGST